MFIFSRDRLLGSGGPDFFTPFRPYSCPHSLGRISPIFPPSFPVFCAFSPPRRDGSNEPQAGTQGQETVARAPKHRFAGLANSGCSERMAAKRRLRHVRCPERSRLRPLGLWHRRAAVPAGQRRRQPWCGRGCGWRGGGRRGAHRGGGAAGISGGRGSRPPALRSPHQLGAHRQ